jgi:hypothetical protein
VYFPSNYAQCVCFPDCPAHLVTVTPSHLTLFKRQVVWESYAIYHNYHCCHSYWFYSVYTWKFCRILAAITVLIFNCVPLHLSYDVEERTACVVDLSINPCPRRKKIPCNKLQPGVWIQG